jgi:hypothetical protein
MKVLVDETELRVLLRDNIIIQLLEAKDNSPYEMLSGEEWEKSERLSFDVLKKYKRVN